ncbi:MAG: hypothetical protein Q4A36_01910 [Candidatus Saccharibacteria bacterium]|nr:hypothetical protein [Candidatus Saccharibacteria bacterium]
MNPSSNSGGLGVPGTKPGVIASGPSGDDDKPKPIVSGPDVSAQPNASMQPSSLVQPGGSVQPGASMQSMASVQSAQQTMPTQSVQPNILTQPNTPAQPNMRPVMPTQPGVSMQSNTPTRPSVFTRPGMPIRTTSDDPIILDNSDGKRKSKRNWIIGGILMLVAVVTVVLAIVMATRGGGGGSHNNGYTGTNGDFYRYANYLLNGDDKEISSLGGEYDESREYAAVKALEDKNVDFFNKAKELWSGFYERIMNDDKMATTSRLYGDTKEENALLDFLSKYVAVKDYWVEESILGLYYDNGKDKDKALNLIKENYAELKNTVYEFGMNYANAAEEAVIATLNLYDAYDALGCMTNEDDACIERNSTALSAVSDAYATSVENMQNNDLEILDELREMMRICYQIERDFSLDNNWIIEEYKDEDGNEK